MPNGIVFGAINVGGQESNGTVSIGQNAQNSWSSHSKINSGISMVFGTNGIFGSTTFISDPELIDMPVNDNEIATSGQGAI